MGFTVCRLPISVFVSLIGSVKSMLGSSSGKGLAGCEEDSQHTPRRKTLTSSPLAPSVSKQAVHAISVLDPKFAIAAAIRSEPLVPETVTASGIK
jgi:hypothetical protein